MKTIGMLAGKGLYPATFLEGVRRQADAMRVVVVAFRGETDPKLEEEVDVLEWFRVGQLGKICKFLKKEGDYIHAETPDLILLDLNLPKRDGREVLEEIKTDDQLKRIPVVILTTSNAEQDILKSYNLHVNCYINKPVDFDKFFDIIQKIEDFWLTTAILPTMTS